MALVCGYPKASLSNRRNIGVQSPEGVSLRLLKHWCVITRRRSSQITGTLVVTL
ncbi:TPA: hypothetical protein G8N56_004006 [Salmonella enterica]|nr:hypothetical protein [Salmonella enterica]